MTLDEHREACIEATSIQCLRYQAGYGADGPASEEWAKDFFAKCKDKPHLGDCHKAEVKGPATCSRCCVDEAIATGTAAFDALHGIARVCPGEATEEMIEAGVETSIDFHRPSGNTRVRHVYEAMSAAGDLTNAPEGK